MRKLGWYAVSAAVAALIAGGVLLLGANLYVQSVTVQHRIRQALTAALKMPVSMRKTTFTPWDGLRVDGIVVREDPDPAASDPAPPDFLTADSFRIRFGLLPLLRREFVVRQVLLDHPQLVWPQDSSGRWQFPPRESATKAAKADHHRPNAGPAVAETVPPPPPATAPTADPEQGAPAVAAPPPEQGKPATPGRAVASKYTVAVEHFRLRHGTLDFLDLRDRLLGRFEEVNVDGRLANPDHVSGDFAFEKGSLPRAAIALTKFHGNFAYAADDELRVTSGRGLLAGGSIAVNYHLQLRNDAAPFSAECHVQDVSLVRLFAEAGSKFQPIEGRLQGSLKISGSSGDAASRTATGNFQLLDTQLKNLPLLQAVGEALRIHDLSHLKFKQAELACRLQGTTLEIEPLLLASNDFRISAHGRYATDNERVDLQARLTIDQAISRQLPQFIEANFAPCGDEAPGSRFIDFTVSGPLNKLNTNLFDRALSGPMNGLFENLVAPRPKSGRKGGRRGNKNNGSPAATPAATPPAIPTVSPAATPPAAP